MQRLVPAMPASLLKEPAFKACENIIYLVARQGLGNACGLVSGFKNVLCEITDGLNMWAFSLLVIITKFIRMLYSSATPNHVLHQNFSIIFAAYDENIHCFNLSSISNV